MFAKLAIASTAALLVAALALPASAQSKPTVSKPATQSNQPASKPASQTPTTPPKPAPKR